VNAYAEATETILRKLVDDVFDQLDGIPEADLNEWLPRDGMNDVNTFYVLATHSAGAGEFWILEAAGGRPVHRHRPDEFEATGTLDDLRRRYDQWLADAHEVLGGLSEEDLGKIYAREANPAQGLSAVRWTVAACIVHAVEHTAVHVGHLQLQRQLWDAEHAAG
jgi:hypothetical protein